MITFLMFVIAFAVVANIELTDFALVIIDMVAKVVAVVAGLFAVYCLVLGV